MNNHQHQISSLQEIHKDHNHSQFDDDFLQMLSSASPWADNQITHGAATPMMLHLLSRTHDASFSLPQGDHNDVVHVPSFNPHAIQVNFFFFTYAPDSYDESNIYILIMY